MAIGDPIGEDLCVGTTDGDTLPSTGGEERQITFVTPIELTEGVKYAIVVRASDAVDYDDGALWMGEDNGYADGNRLFSNDGGLTWTAQEHDQWFKTLAEAVEKDSRTFEGTGQASWIYGSAWWEAQTFTASFTYTITSVILKLRRTGAGATPGTITVSIRETVGVPRKPINPAPTDTASDVTLDQATVTWEDGGLATSYNVHYGVNAGSLVLVSEGQEGLSLTITGITSGSPFEYAVSRAWRIDAVNDIGTTTGDTWTFTSITFDPVLPGASGGEGGNPGGENNIVTLRRLVAAANSKIWYEDI